MKAKTKALKPVPKEFFEYCWGFYGPRGLYAHFFGGKLKRRELLAAATRRVNTDEFCGDTFDREAVRDILLAARGQVVGGVR